MEVTSRRPALPRGSSKSSSRWVGDEVPSDYVQSQRLLSTKNINKKNKLQSNQSGGERGPDAAEWHRFKRHPRNQERRLASWVSCSLRAFHRLSERDINSHIEIAASRYWFPCDTRAVVCDRPGGLRRWRPELKTTDLT